MSALLTLKPPKSLLQGVGRALAKYQMIGEGDRVLIGLSGGKDSLSLLMLLRHFQRHSPVRFELACATVDPQIPGFDPKPLGSFLESLDIPWIYHGEDLVAQAEASMRGDSFCSFCARKKRGILYSICREQGFNVLALGQHLDDVAESFMMSVFRQGQLQTMKANYWNDAGDVRIIRPLINVRESQTRAFAQDAQLPVIPDNCPACFSKPQEREKMKLLLQSMAKDNKNLFASMRHALEPLIADTNAQLADEQED